MPQPKMDKECIELARRELARFTEDDLREYVNLVFDYARDLGDSNSTMNIQAAIEHADNAMLQSLFEDCKITANNTAKYERIVDKIKNKVADMRSLFVRRYSNLDYNVESSQRETKRQLQAKFFGQISQEEFAYFTDKNNQLDIARAYDGKEAPPLAKAIADKLQDYIDFRNAEMVMSDALTLKDIRGDRYFRHNHNATKMINAQKSLVASAKDALKSHDTAHAKRLWIDTIKPLLDLKSMLKGTEAYDGLFETIDDAKVEEILSNAFDNITTGKSEIFTKSAVVNDREAVKRKRHMFFIFNDMESYAKYNETYGTGDLFSALKSDIEGSGNRAGAARLLGDSPYSMYAAMREAQATHDPKGNTWYKHTEYMFQEVMGENKTATSPTMATFFSNLRSLSMMARLIKITMQSLSDLHAAAVFAKRWGYSYWNAYGELFGHMFNAFETEERKYIAELFKYSIDNHLGYMGKFIDAHNTGEVMSKATNMYFRGLGMEALDKGNKVSLLSIMSRHLAEMSKHSFSNLPPELAKQLKKFNLTEKEWDLLRKKNKKLPNGPVMFTTENVDALTNDEIKTLYVDSDKSIPLYEMRNNLSRKVHSMFDVAAENAVITPGAWTKAWCTWGTKPGTTSGEILRTVLQFKSYALTYMDRVLAQGWRDSEGASGKMLWATQMVAAVMPLAFMSMAFENISNGVSPMPDVSKMSFDEQERFWLSLTMPSLGIFFGILDPDKQNQDLVLSLFTSPTTRLIGNGAASALALTQGDGERAAKNFGKMANYMLPIQSPPFLGPILNQALGRESYLQPGQTHIYGQ